MLEISNTVQAHLFETLDEMKINVAKDLNIPEDNITFKEYNDRTDICVEKNGKQVCICVAIKGE